MSTPTATRFTIQTSNPHVMYQANEASRGDDVAANETRWYWSKVVNGEIAYNNSTKLRSSARRAILRDMKHNQLTEVTRGCIERDIDPEG